MRIIRINVNGYNFEFVCDSRDTRNGFAHDYCTLFVNGIQKTTAHCYYINRTWECWAYQSVCRSAIYDLINDRTNAMKEIFKREHDYKVMTKKRLEEFKTSISNDKSLAAYHACYDNLNHKMH